VKKKLAIISNCAILFPVSERNTKMNNEMKNEFKIQVKSLLSEDALHLGNVESNVEQALNEGWTIEECAKQCESDV
jgi:hypothetical protein